jgi:hypothetical protein
MKLSLRPRLRATSRLRFSRYGEDQSPVARAAHRGSQPRLQARERDASSARPYVPMSNSARYTHSVIDFMPSRLPCAHRKPPQLWWKRNTQMESPRLRSTVTGHEPFFVAACHMGFDARFGVQDLALLGEPPVEAPPRPHLRRGFLWLGSLKESWKFLRPLQAACFRRRADMHVRPNPVSGSLRSTASGSPIRRSHQDGATGC